MAQSFQKCSDGDPTVCGNFSKCIDGDSGRESDEYGGAYCECLKEYYGPPPNCTRVCKFDCKSNEYCDLNEEICKVGCRSSDDCKNNEVCDDDNNCVAYECMVDSDCKSDESCIHIDDTKKCLNSCEQSISKYSYSVPSISFPFDFETKTGDPITTKKPNAATLCGENSVCKAIDHKQYCACIDGYFPENDKGCRKRVSSDILPKDEDLDCKKYCGRMSSCKIFDESILCYCQHSGFPHEQCDTPQYLPAKKPKSKTAISLASLMVLSGRLESDTSFSGEDFN